MTVWLDNISIRRRMILSFSLILFSYIVFMGYSITQMNTLGELTVTLYEHPMKVSNAAIEAKAGALRMVNGMKDVLLSGTDMEMNQAVYEILSEETKVFQYLNIVKERILGPEGKALIEETIAVFAGWKPIRMEVEQLVLQGDRKTAHHIARGKGADYASVLDRKLTELAAYATKKADRFMADAGRVRGQILRDRIITIGILALLSWLITYLITHSIDASVSALKETMAAVTASGTLVKSNLTGNSEIVDMARHFNQLVDRLQDQFWVKNGQNALNEALAGDLGIEDLATKGIHFISRYVDACAGVLYAVDQKTSLCRLKASYALAEGKHFPNECRPGQGVVGQVAVEKEPILLKGITREDALGKTGTLREPPRSIYAVPLLYEDQLIGVMEVASFQEMRSQQTELLTLAAHILATRLHGAAQQAKIKNLLEVTQQDKEALTAQAGELQAQTEELRQQSEELQQQSEELQEQNIELQHQGRQLEASGRLKSEFLSNMSHELRTPLNSVLALSRVLLRQAAGKLSKEEMNYLSIIERNGKNLLALINDILDLSKIEAGKMEIVANPFNIRLTIETVMEMMAPLAEEKGIALSATIPDPFPRIESDESRVHQILQNLIGNAVKFTEKGGVTVSARSDGPTIYIEIKDTGIGIPENCLSQIFEEFRQVDGTASRKYEGTGLGLAIAAKAAKMLGGDLTVESVLGQGAAFLLTLPVHPPEMMPASAPLVLTKANRNCSGNVLLLIEDNEAATIQVKMILEDRGYRVDVAPGGRAALEYVRHTIPDGIILDLMMPGVDGFEVLETIRGTEATSGIPVLILTAKDLTSEDLRRLSANHIQQLIQKGDVDREGLLFKVERMLGAISKP
jgi:signal transduction histidine kinase/CheY-like chemotaxis protein